MNLKAVKTIIFVIWIVAITALSVIPYSKNGTASLKLTGSGMVLHFVGYFVASSLFYQAYRKDTLFSILFLCFSIFLFGVVLEIVQVFLPYRTFNPVDIAANGVGVVAFMICWGVFKGMRREEAGGR